MKNHCRFLLVVSFAFAVAACAETTLLSNLNLEGMRQAHGQPHADASYLGTPLSVAGKSFAHGIGTHAASSWTLPLDGRARRITGLAGVTDSPGNETGTCVFIINGDGRELWNSGKITEGDPAKPFDVSLAGIKSLDLIVNAAGDNDWSDHAAWLEPVLEHDGAPLAASGIPPALELKRAPSKISGRVRAADYGLVPDTGKDTGPAFTRLLAVAAPGTTLLLEKGRYDVWRKRASQRPWQQSNSDPQPMRFYGILMENLRNVTLDGAGSDLVFHGTQTGIGLAFCTNMTLKNFTIDWQRPELSQGLVLETGTNFVVVRMHPDTPGAVENGRLVFPGEGWTHPRSSTMEWNPKTGGPAYQRGDLAGPGAASQVGPGVFRLETRQNYKVGNVVIFRHGARTHCSMLIHRCANTAIENVDTYSSCGLGFLAQHSDDVRFTGVRYIPKPGSGRLFSSRDDGLQVSGCKGRIEVDRCEFEGMMDDPINVHGTYLPVTGRVDERTLRCRFGQHQSVGQTWWADPGDRVEYVFRDSVLSHGSNAVLSFKLLNDNEAEIRLKNPVPDQVGPGWVLENMDAHPSVVIRNSRFGNQRARGVLFTTPRPVLIENNTFYTSGSAILINGDANGWFESGAVRDAVIRGNTFINCNQTSYQFGEAVISIDPVVNKPEPGSYSHSNIRIEKNIFKTFDAPVLYAESVDGLKFTGNTIERTRDFAPWHYRKAAVTLDRCKDVAIRGTKLIGDVLGPVVKNSASNLKLDANDGLKLK